VKILGEPFQAPAIKAMENISNNLTRNTTNYQYLQFAVGHDFRCPAFPNQKQEFLENHLPPTSLHIKTLKKTDFL
jgi:hypothetical protein